VGYGVNIEKYLWLSFVWQQCNVKSYKLLNDFGGIEGLYSAGRKDLADLGYLNGKEIRSLLDKREKLIYTVLETCREKGIDIITIEDAIYPKRLKNIYNPPLVIYMRGKLPDLENTPSITIVGTRNPSDAGILITDRLSKDLARSGFITVSGLAKGIDATAHKGTLIADGITVAVLGCGVDVVYPAENAFLINHILRSGAIISEYPPGTKPLKENFPCRNRILAGLTQGTLVTEAPERSGALITARIAADEGREVFAVPGNVFHTSGTNNLIKNGAKPVTEALDIIEEFKDVLIEKPVTTTVNFAKYDDMLKVSSHYVEYNGHKQNNISLKNNIDDLSLTENEIIIKNALSDTPLSIDEIDDKTKLEIGPLLASLTMLEIKGYIKSLPGGRYILD